MDDPGTAGGPVPALRVLVLGRLVPDVQSVIRGMWWTAAAIWAAVALAFLPAAVDALGPDIAPGRPERPTRTPQAVRTAHSAPPPTRVDKRSLIIEQNPNCWTGRPGQTCGPERTYH